MPPSASSPVSRAPQPELDNTDAASTSSEDRPPRTLILCFDGTADQYDGNNTNVVKFYSLLKKDDASNLQLCYYQPGIGTYLNPGVVSPLFQWCAKILDEAFAWYLDAHVRGGYQFLMQNYVPGDKICIFGFSRGAYTARALAGMLHKIGLLPRDNPEQVPFAYNLYKKTDAKSLALAAGFKETFCRDVQIEFVGVWETVTSVGVITGRTLPFTAVNTTIKTFRHALSLDEHRVRFLPSLYQDVASTQATPPTSKSTAWEKTADPGEIASSPKDKIASKRPISRPKRQRSLRSFLRKWQSKSQKNTATIDSPQVKQEVVDVEAAITTAESSGSSEASIPIRNDDVIIGGTDVLEVWFAGCHADVGGGAVSDDTKISLSDITLRWMVREVVRAQCGIEFDQAALARARIPESIFTETSVSGPATTASAPVQSTVTPGPVDPSGSGSSGDPSTDPSGGSGSDPLDASADALQPIHDELKLDPLWWAVEVIPMSYEVLEPSGNWTKKWWIHLGRGRQIPDIKPNFHVTVRERMQDVSLNYTPRAKWMAGTEIYVD